MSGSGAGLTCHRLFEATARQVPDAVAIVAGERRVTYAELDRLADVLAVRLVRAGARPESCVGVLVDRSVEQIVAALAAWKSGAAYLALDATAPRRHVGRLVSDAQPVVVVTQGRLAPLIPGEVSTVVVDDLAAPAQAEGGERHDDRHGRRSASEAEPDNAAAVIYT